MSEDEGLMPDQPSFVGLFHPQLFKSLHHKTKTTTWLGSIHTTPDPATGATDPADTLFAEPAIEAEEVLTPRQFLDVVQRQWNSPGSGPNPSGLDRRFYNMGMDLAKVLPLTNQCGPVLAFCLNRIPGGKPPS